MRRLSLRGFFGPGRLGLGCPLKCLERGRNRRRLDHIRSGCGTVGDAFRRAGLSTALCERNLTDPFLE